MNRLGVFLSLVTAAAFCSGCPQHAEWMELHWLEFEGRDRSYHVFIPESPKGVAPSFLLVALHPFAGTSMSMARLTGFNDLAAEFNCVVVYPNGIPRRWNYDLAVNPSPLFPEVDDVGFIDAVIGEVKADLALPDIAVFVTGFSNGAFMAQRYALERTDAIAGVASVSGTLDLDLATSVSPENSLPALHIHGDADTVVPIEGGEIEQGPGSTSTIVSADDLIAIWTTANTCIPLATGITMLDSNPEDGTSTTIETHLPCASGNEVQLYIVENGGHTWPGSNVRVSYGLTSQDFSASRVILEFFAGTMTK